MQPDQIAKVYAQVFGADGGIKVLEDLRREFYDVPMFPQCELKAGRHDVVLYILDKLKQGQTNGG